MEPQSYNNDIDAPEHADVNQANPQEARRQSIQRCIQSLVHVCQCRDSTCTLLSCQRMKRVITHTKVCKRKVTGDCPICKQLIALCCHHAKYCQDSRCSIGFCSTIKNKIIQEKFQLLDYAMQQLMVVLRAPLTPNQRQEILKILQANPPLVALIRQMQGLPLRRGVAAA